MKSECNVCNDVIIKEKCCIQCRTERYSLIIILSLILFWAADFLQINYVLRMMFYDVNSAVMITEWAFSIKFVNNDLSVTWESRDEV